MNNLDLDREAWLGEAADFILTDKIEPLMNGRDYPAPYRISIGYPPRSRGNSKVIATCIKSEASAGGFSEIFVSPKLGDSIPILEALCHELCHFSDDCASGHKHHFARVARKIGLIGKLTATTANPELITYLESIVETLGEIPHDAINLDQAKPKQTTRMIKLECDPCSFNFRASQTQIDKIDNFECIACRNGIMRIVV